MEQHQYQLRKAESLNRMAGAIAHHFSNKLMGVLGNLELALNHPCPNPEIVRKLTVARQSANDASEMSRLMLIYLGQTAARRESVDLASACREVMEKQNALMPKHSALKTEIPPHGPVIRAEPQQVRNILEQLITNAREAIGEGKSNIRIAVGVIPATAIESAHIFPVGWEPMTETYACFEVSTKFVGRGLGLAVVLGALRMHQGAIAVESKPGQGSTFRVFWPLEAPEAQPVRVSGE
jgi:signal transduction histidine kinase